MSNHIGQRLSFESHLCTVRYIGSVSGTQGQWLGVEWDEPSRGKHNGEHQGVRYFECLTRHTTAASFVRPTRVSDSPGGKSFLQALREKYVDIEGVPGISHPVYFNGKLAEEVGFDKIRRQLAALQELKIVILDGMCISGIRQRQIPLQDENLAADLETAMLEIKRTCPAIRQLDLSRSLLEHWVDVAAICQPLLSLSTLNLSRNRFCDLQFDWWSKRDCREAFENVSELILDSTLLTWTQLLGILRDFPSITALSLISNELSHVPAGLPASLRSLNLADNKFSSLQELAELAKSKNLEWLSLRSCPIQSLKMGSDTRFASLSFLDIYETQLSDSELGDLSIYFPALKSLHLSIRAEEDSLRTIARISTLITLNYSTVSLAARKDAEIFYLSQIAKEISASPISEQPIIISRHRRWRELCNSHGEPAITRAALDSHPVANNLGSRFVLLHCFDHRASPPGTRIAEDEAPAAKLHLPMSWSIYRIHAWVASKFDVLPLYLRLVWETEEMDPATTQIVPAGEDDRDPLDVPAGDDAKYWSTHWVKREVVLEPGPRDLGFWIESSQVRIRVESTERKVRNDANLAQTKLCE